MHARIAHILYRLRSSTPLHTFILLPLLVVACELLLRHGVLGLDLWGVPLLILGYTQYRLVGNFRTAHGGGGPGIDNPPTRIVAEGPYRLTRNPMYLGHLIFMLGLAVSFWSAFALALAVARAVWFHRRVVRDETRLEALFGAQYAAYRARTPRWLPTWHAARSAP